jgi:hypothetical protein
LKQYLLEADSACISVAAAGELIFSPLVSKLQSLGVTILGSRRVQEILPAHHIQEPGSADNPSSSSSSSRGQLPGVVVAKGPDGVVERHAADVIVLAAGVPALQQLLRSSPVLAAAGEIAAVKASFVREGLVLCSVCGSSCCADTLTGICR